MAQAVELNGKKILVNIFDASGRPDADHAFHPCAA